MLKINANKRDELKNLGVGNQDLCHLLLQFLIPVCNYKESGERKYCDKISVHDKHPRAGCNTQMTSTKRAGHNIQYSVNTT